MKQYGSVVTLSCLMILLFVFPAIGAVDWLEIGKDSNGDIILYKVEGRTNDRVEVWGKRIFSDEGGKEFIRDSRSNGLNTEGWKKLGHFTSFYEIDCKQRISRVLSVVIYAADGQVVYASSFGQPRWEPIDPGSLGAIFEKKVCE